MHGNPEIRETLTPFFSSGTKLLLPSWLLGFRHEERETQFLLCWLFLHRPSVNSPVELSAQNQNLNSLTQQTRGASRRPQLVWPRPETNFNWLFFSKITKISSPSFPGMASSHPSPFPIWGFYYDICDCHIIRAHRNVCTCTCTKPNSSKPNQTEW